MQNLDQATLQQILAMRNAQMRAGGNDSAEWWYDPNKTYDPATDTHGYMLENTYGFNDVGTGDSSTRVRDNSQDRAVIRRLRAGTGGKLGDMWDDKGNYIGEYQAQDGGGKQLNTAIALMAGGYLGGNYLAGLEGATGAAGSGLSGIDAAMVDMGAGATNVGAAGGTAATLTGGMQQAASTAGSELVKSALDSAMTPKTWVDLAKLGTAAVGTALAASNGSAGDAQARANAVNDVQQQGMQFALDQSKELADYNRTTFRPVEQRLVQGAMDYATPTRMESAAQQASGRVASEFDQTRNQAGREMIRYGVDPSTIAALGASSQLDEAKARAGAANQARDSVEQQGWSRMADVASLGRNIASSQATQQQIGVKAGEAATYGAATSARIGQADDDMLIKGVGQIGNYVGNLFATSDKAKKRGTGRMADAAGALEQIEATPVHDGWTYRDDPTRTPRVGPMAQDVRDTMGGDVAPSGKVIDLVSMNGRMMAAVQELARKVKKLEKAA